MKRSSKNSKSISSDNLKTVPVATAPDDTIGTLDVRDDQLEKAFRMYAPQYRVITPDRYVAMTVDMVATATTIIAGGTRIAPFGDEIRTLPKFDAKELVLDLANVGYAMFYANQLTIGATASRDVEKNHDATRARPGHARQPGGVRDPRTGAGRGDPRRERVPRSRGRPRERRALDRRRRGERA